MLRLFISYSRLDHIWCRRLSDHLQGLRGTIFQEIWHDEDIDSGDDWREQISDHLDQADIVLLLLSSNFLQSEACFQETDRAMERRASGSCLVIPIMLRECNPSDTALGSLNSVPPHDCPIIRSEVWPDPDKDRAFTLVSKQVEALARKRLGTGAKYKLLHPRRNELTVLLHHLCDRNPQKEALHTAFNEDRRKTRRPFVIVMQGRQHDSLEWFLHRLENVLLPKYLGEKPGRLSPLKWPDYVPGKTPFQLFGSNLADCLPVSPFANIREMNLSLGQLSPVTLLPCSVPSSRWGESEQKLIQAFFTLWREWPRLPQDRFLVPVVEIQYPDDHDVAEAIAGYLQGVRFDNRNELGGAILPQMSEVEYRHFREWLNDLHVRAQLASPEKALETSIAFTKVFPIRMHPLAEMQLPRFLDEI